MSTGWPEIPMQTPCGKRIFPRSTSDLSTTMNRQGAEQSELRDTGKDLPVGPCSWTRRGRCSANVCTAAAALHNFLSRQYYRCDPASRGGVGVKTVNDDSVYACVCMEEPRGKKRFRGALLNQTSCHKFEVISFAFVGFCVCVCVRGFVF